MVLNQQKQNQNLKILYEILKIGAYVILFHLLINIILYSLILTLPVIVAFIIGLPIIFLYFVLGLYITEKYGVNPSIFTILVLYTVINIIVVVLIYILNEFHFMLPVSLATSYISIYFMFMTVLNIKSYYIFYLLILPIFIMPVILMKAGSAFSKKKTIKINLIRNLINTVFTNWKVTLTVIIIYLILLFPLSTINFSYEVKKYHFGTLVYSYSLNSNRIYNKAHFHYDGEIRDIKKGKVTYLQYLTKSSNEIFYIPIKRLMEFRGEKPYITTEGYIIEEIQWGWRTFNYYY